MIKLEILHLPVRVREKDTRKSARSHMSLRRNSKVSIMEETKPHTSVSLPRVEENTFRVLHNVLYSGKLLRKKTFTNFRDFVAISVKFGGVESLWPYQPQFMKKCFPPIHEKFFAQKFPNYTVHCCMKC